jgi:hypothetical protein
MIVVTHRIAGITFRTESDVCIPHLQEDPFERFRVNSDEFDVHYRIRQFDPDPPTLLPLSSQEREYIARSIYFPQRWLDNRIFRSPEVRAVVQRCLDHPELVHIALTWNRAVFRNFAYNEFEIFYPPEKRRDFADRLFVAGYRNLLAPSLPNLSAVMIHGAGVIRNGVAMVFLASDEGGKTSVVKHSTGAPILNDDHLILRQEGEVVVAHGTPLGCMTSGPQQARLAGFFLLEKSSHFELIPIQARDILEFLWNECRWMWYVLPKSLRVRAFEILYAACQQAIAYKMRFPQDYIDWEAIDASMVKQMRDGVCPR